MLSTLNHTRALAARNVRCLSSAAPAAQPSLLDRVLRPSSMPKVPLSEAYPTTPAISPEAAQPAGPPQITTLSSGVRVASLPSNVPVGSIGVFVDSGSRYEDHSTTGISTFLELLAFKSTKNRSDLALVRQMLGIGANVTCSTSREHTVYSVDFLSPDVEMAVATLGDVIQNQAFLPDELKEAREFYTEENKEREQAADIQIMEAIHAAGYFNNTVGQALYAPTNHLEHYTADVLTQWTNTMYTSNRMAIVGVGVEHEDLCKLVDQHFEARGDAVQQGTPSAEYTGGDVRVHKKDSPDGLAHIAIAFEGASWHDKDLIPMCVLQFMMGGGGSFSAGGPGKGMYSRLFEHVLNRHGWVESALCFNSIFSESAIFGIQGAAQPQMAAQLVDVISGACQDMAGPVDPTELARAKEQLVSSIHMQLEHRSLRVDDFGRQLLAYNKVESAHDMAAKVAAVSAQDIQRVASNMLKTAPSVAAFGDLSFAPRYDTIAQRFN